jgi:hypothetical protein
MTQVPDNQPNEDSIIIPGDFGSDGPHNRDTADKAPSTSTLTIGNPTESAASEQEGEVGDASEESVVKDHQEKVIGEIMEEGEERGKKPVMEHRARSRSRSSTPSVAASTRKDSVPATSEEPGPNPEDEGSREAVEDGNKEDVSDDKIEPDIAEQTVISAPSSPSSEAFQEASTLPEAEAVEGEEVPSETQPDVPAGGQPGVPATEVNVQEDDGDDFGDFDDFGDTVEADGGDDFNDFDDFGGFEDGDTSGGFDEPPSAPEPAPPPPPQTFTPQLPVPLPDFGGDPTGVDSTLSIAVEKMFPVEGERRKPTSVEGRSFLTDRSQSLWNQLVAPPPLQPPNWKISRIRRLFLVSLGIPLDLDDILPPETKQKKLVLPSVHLSRQVDSRPSSRSSRRSGSLPRNKKKAEDNKPEELDIPRARILCSTSPVALRSYTIQELRKHIQKLEHLTQVASEVLTYWLGKRDSAVGDKETFETVIESLVGYARKKRQNG